MKQSINETDYKPLGMYRTTPAIYDSMSEFEEDDAMEEVEEDISVPPNPTNFPTQATDQCGTEVRFPRIPQAQNPWSSKQGRPTTSPRESFAKKITPPNSAEPQMQTPSQTSSVRPRNARPHPGRMPTTPPPSLGRLQNSAARATGSRYHCLYPNRLSVLRHQRRSAS